VFQMVDSIASEVVAQGKSRGGIADSSGALRAFAEQVVLEAEEVVAHATLLEKRLDGLKESISYFKLG